MIRRFLDAWSMVWIGIRYPSTQKKGWINTGAWTVALALVGISVAADLITKQYMWLIWMFVVGTFDFIMLHRSLEGLLWRRSLDKWLQSRLK